MGVESIGWYRKGGLRDDAARQACALWNNQQCLSAVLKRNGDVACPRATACRLRLKGIM